MPRLVGQFDPNRKPNHFRQIRPTACTLVVRRKGLRLHWPLSNYRIAYITYSRWRTFRKHYQGSRHDGICALMLIACIVDGETVKAGETAIAAIRHPTQPTSSESAIASRFTFYRV